MGRKFDIIFPSCLVGIGHSKKLARRHASENLLALMEARGLNIDPSSISKRQKVRLKM